MQLIQALFLILSFILTLMFFIYGFNHYFLIMAQRHYKIPRLPPFSDEKRPRVAIHLPIYNERYVVHRLVEACVRMVEQYGVESSEIVILDDSTDETVQIVDETVKEYQNKKINIAVKRRENRQGYKAGALQMALENTQAEFIAVFDADFTPPPDFLLRTVPYFLQDEGLAIVQSRWTHQNRYFNPVTAAAALGIDVHFIIEQTGRYASKCLQNFNGSGGVLRKRALDEAGGWQSDTLAEDLDASYRIQLKGYHLLYLRDLHCPGEIPPTLPGFKKQQARWANGSLRVARKLLLPVLRDKRLKFYQRLEAFIHLTGYILHPLIYTSFLLTSLGTIFNVDTFLTHPHVLTPFGGTAVAFSPAMAQMIHDLSWTVMDSMVILSMVAVWLSPLMSLKAQKLSIRKNLPNFIFLFLLGSGISVSNTIEAIKALLTNKQWEFTRTPKYANIRGKEGWRTRSYQIPLDFVFVLEVISLCIGLTAIVFAILDKHYTVLSILVPYTSAYFFIVLLTFQQSRPMMVKPPIKIGSAEPARSTTVVEDLKRKKR